MKLLLNSLVMTIAAAIGLTVGFALRGKVVSEMAETPAAITPVPSNVQRGKFRGSKQQAGIRSNDDSPVVAELERDLSMSSGVTRWLYWLEAIENATTADFPGLARLAQGNSTATRLIAARWVELDPRHLFDTIVSAQKNRSGFSMSEFASVLFEEWPRRDPEAVVAALNGAEDFVNRSRWRVWVANILLDKDVERGLRLMSEWHIENHVSDMTAVAKWAEADPRHAAEFTLENPAGYASRKAMETIGKEWAKSDPARALEFAASKPGKLGSMLATAAMKEWTGRNLSEAGDWLAAADAKTRNRLSSAFVETWAKQDATSALTWCETNLVGTSLAQAVGGVLKGAADKNVVEAAELVAGMNPSQARAEAALAVAQKWLPESSSDKPVAPEMIKWLASLDADSVKRVLEQTYLRWSGADPKSMAAFLASASADQIPPHAYSSLAGILARKNPSEALEWASRLPEDRRLSAGSAAFFEWQRSQPESAIKWLSGLSSSDPRRQPFFSNAIANLAHSPQGAEQLAALPPSDRITARRIIEVMPLSEDRRSKLLNILKPR